MRCWLASLLTSALLQSGFRAGTLRWTTPAPVAPDTASRVFQSGAVVTGADTVLWLAWLEQREEGPVRLKMSRHDGTRWRSPDSVSMGDSEGRDPGPPCLVLDDQMDPWMVFDVTWGPGPIGCAYVRRSGDTWTHAAMITRDTARWGATPALGTHPRQGVQALWVRMGFPYAYLLTAQGSADSWTQPSVVDSFPGYMLDFTPAVAPLNDSQLMAAWYCSYDGSNFDLHTCVGVADSWGEPVLVVFHDPADDCRPRLCVDTSGLVRVVWYRAYSMTYSARYDGAVWVDPVLLDSNARWANACTDERGWTWVVYTRQYGSGYQSLVRPHDGTNWGEPSPGPADSTATVLYIAAAHGRLWAVWQRRLSPTKVLLYYSHTLPSGVAEQNPPALPQRPGLPAVTLSVIRAGTSLHLTGLRPGQKVQLLDAAGRELNPQAEALSTSFLPPGVYFLRIGGTGQPVTRKVLVVK